MGLHYWPRGPAAVRWAGSGACHRSAANLRENAINQHLAHYGWHGMVACAVCLHKGRGRANPNRLIWRDMIPVHPTGRAGSVARLTFFSPAPRPISSLMKRYPVHAMWRMLIRQEHASQPAFSKSQDPRTDKTPSHLRIFDQSQIASCSCRSTGCSNSPRLHRCRE